MTPSSDRPQPFRVGEAYTAKASFPAAPAGGFVAGRAYLFLGAYPNRYDATTRMLFQTLDREEQLSWDWEDDDPDGLCEERFHIRPY